MRIDNGSRELSLFDPSFAQMFGELMEIFPRTVSSSPSVEAPFPALNAWENGDAIVVEAEVPGLNLNDLELTVHEDELSIRGVRKSDHPEGATVLRHERGAGPFRRALRLPCAVDVEKIDAGLRNGVITITLPKAPELRPRKIDVKVRND